MELSLLFMVEENLFTSYCASLVFPFRSFTLKLFLFLFKILILFKSAKRQKYGSRWIQYGLLFALELRNFCDSESLTDMKRVRLCWIRPKNPFSSIRQVISLTARCRLPLNLFCSWTSREVLFISHIELGLSLDMSSLLNSNITLLLFQFYPSRFMLSIKEVLKAHRYLYTNFESQIACFPFIFRKL